MGESNDNTDGWMPSSTPWPTSLPYTTDGINGTNTSQNVDGNLTSERVFTDTLRRSLELVISLIGLPGALLLIAMTLTPKYRKFSYSLYLTVMSIYDVIFLLFFMSDSLLQMTQRKILRSVLIWEFPCRFYDYMYYVSMNVSAWMNVALAADRFVIIRFPLKKDAICNRRNSWIVSGAFMFYIHSIGVVYIVYGKVNYYPGSGYYCNGKAILEDFDLFLSYIGGIVVSVIFIAIFTVASVTKLYDVKKQRLAMTKQQPISTKDKTSKATVALILISVLAVVTQLPHIVRTCIFRYAFYFDTKMFIEIITYAWPGYFTAIQVIDGMSKIINIQNFYVLFALNGHFREDAKNLLMCRQMSK